MMRGAVVPVIGGSAGEAAMTIRSPRGDAVAWRPPEGGRLAVYWYIRHRFPALGPCLGVTIMPLEMTARRLDGVLGWGGRGQARLARAYAALRGLPYWTVEDGFLRSVGLGKAGSATVSIVVDDLGIHFQAERPSRLERLLAEDEGEVNLDRARALRDLIVRHRLTKYNHLPDRPVDLPATRRRRLLLVDQVVGDQSIVGAGAGPDTFARMWEAARTEGDAEIVVKGHPDVIAGSARGYLAPLAGDRGIRVLADAVSPHAILDRVDEVWTVSSQLGLDALVRGIPVVTFGVPAYAGWGLTEDRAEGEVARAAFTRRRRRISIDDYVDAAFLRYALYLDPVTGRRTTAEHAAERLLSWRSRALGLTGRYVCLGLSRHKRKVARLYLGGPWSEVRFAPARPSRRHLRAGDHVVVWGRGDGVDLAAVDVSASVIHVEDGFVRSVGLGSALKPPASLCFDTVGPYFDATAPNGLERLLDTADFDDALLARAARLRERIVSGRLTKYNLPQGAQPDYRRLADGRRVVVVAAQVPGDASLRLGLPLHGSNLALLAAVRRARPAAFIIYKDHPDLVFGMRPGRTDGADLRQHADMVIGHGDVDALLAAADEVHVATSQLGFEALLRGREVHCHGLPFYAGRGLTEDLVRALRPRRCLGLDALVAGVLILYPRYVCWRTRLPGEVEDALAEIEQARGTSERRGRWTFPRWPRS